MELSRNPTPVVRMLISDREDWFIHLTAQLVHCRAKVPITLVSIIPRSMHVNDLLETAAQQNFDFAILFLNNTHYSFRNRHSLAPSPIALVEKMVRLFEKPVIGLDSYHNAPDYRARLLEIGATAVVWIPFAVEDMRQAIKRCVDIC